MLPYQINHFQTLKYIIDAAKRLTVNEFRGVFLRDTLPTTTKKKLNECGILNLDSSSGDGTPSPEGEGDGDGHGDVVQER